MAAGEPSNDRSESVQVGLADDIIGDAPTLQASPEVFNHLANGPDEHVGALENFVGRQLGPTAPQFLSRLAAIVGHDDTLHQRIQFQLRVSFGTCRLAHEPHSLIDAGRPPSGEIR